MPKHYDIAATVRALAPVLKRGGFRHITHRPGLLGTPRYKAFGDVVVFEKPGRRVEICVDKSEVYLILRADGEDPVRPDLDCPRDMDLIDGVACLPRFTHATIRCLRAKLKDWI
jgi:hypothetical protein